uniref:WW domain-containing oxidoreductase n=1 Tax=Aegilops tauschii TaxID=37682 RepID=M8BWN7_AEGTA
MGIWGWPWGRRGLSGFGSASTAEDIAAGIDASHLTAIVTGATNGIGKETARVLALRGANVIIPARTLESGMKLYKFVTSVKTVVVDAFDRTLLPINSHSCVLASIFSLVKPFVKDIPQGAATTCYVALHPDTKRVSGKYFAGCNEATPTSVARDAELAKRLWAFSEELVENRSK